ncbi:MAG: O-antigen ligase family protein [Patescibacteria group bacterium]
MTLVLIAIYAILFALLAWRRFEWALVLFFALLPAYLVRFSLGSIPSTLLETMVWILAIAWLIGNFKLIISSLKNFRLIIKKNESIIIAISFFILGATISVFASENLRAALGEWKAFYIEPVAIFIILVTTLTGKKNNNPTTKQSNADSNHLIEKILFGLVLSGLAVSGLAIYQHFTGWLVPDSFWQNRNTYRVTAWYGFPNGVGLFLAPLLPFAIYFIMKLFGKTRGRRIMSGLLLAVCSALLVLPVLAIVYAKSTGALVGIVAGAGVLLLCYKKTRWPAIIIGAIMLTFFFFLPENNPIKTELLAKDRSGQLRINMWAETGAYLMAHPIKGAGLAGYPEVIYPYRIDKTIEVFHHPHNLFLTIWVNTGLVGLIGFVWVIVWFYRVGIGELGVSALRDGRQTESTALPKTMNEDKINSFVPFLLSAMTVYLTTGLVDSPYIKNDLALLFWLLPALLFAIKK